MTFNTLLAIAMMASGPTHCVDASLEAPEVPVQATPDRSAILPSQDTATKDNSGGPSAAPDASEAPAGSQQPSGASPGTNASTDTGEIVVTAREPSRNDPLESVNAKSFAVTQSVDKALIGPVAMAYQHKIPGPARKGLHNFLSNLHEPGVFINFLLQHKIGKAAETAGRFGINSTIGVAGLVDVAKRRPFNLPLRANGFADTMGFYGVKPGPFMFLPIIGPTTVRDLVGYALDRALLPVAVGKPLSSPAYNLPTGFLHALDKRVEFDRELSEIRGSTDPYVAAREYYLKNRQAEIDGLRGIKSGCDSLDPSS